MSTAALEQKYRKRLLALFARVDAKHPEKGVQTLIQRAHTEAKRQGVSLEQALEAQFKAAVVRTERRLALLGQCSIQQHDDDHNPA